jgi:curved DNA-binding protein CbpA
MDLYDILELEPNASKDEIKKAYIKLVKIYHPDKSGYDSSERFRKIQTAYDILMNDNARQEYHKMNDNERYNFFEILEKIINENVNIDEFKKYGVNLNQSDINHIKNNFINFFHDINIIELFNLFRNGIIPKKVYNDIINCSDSECEIYDEYSCNYYYKLPLYLQKTSLLPKTIKLDINITLNDIIQKNKKKIIIKRKYNDEYIKSTFIFNLSHPYIIFYGGGDVIQDNTGDLIIKLNLPNNLYWDENIIIFEQTISLYDFINGVNIKLDIDEKGDKQPIIIDNWVPYRDGLFIELNKININYLLSIKLCVDINKIDDEKLMMLKKYFS